MPRSNSIFNYHRHNGLRIYVFLYDVFQIARESDFGVNDSTCIVRTHLGLLLKEGDLVLGYDMKHAVVDFAGKPLI
jgi:hypothetical protein